MTTEFLKWLFCEGEGHFALLFVMLLIAAVGASFSLPYAYQAASALWPLVLLKLKP